MSGLRTLRIKNSASRRPVHMPEVRTMGRFSCHCTKERPQPVGAGPSPVCPCSVLVKCVLSLFTLASLRGTGKEQSRPFAHEVHSEALCRRAARGAIAPTARIHRRAGRWLASTADTKDNQFPSIRDVFAEKRIQYVVY